jgi:hypothetical protein
LIVEADASQQTLDARGNPTTAEGQEARQSMDSRRARAVGDRDRLIREIVANAKVFQGGGSEVLLTSLEERIKAATDASLVRMFPRFKEADSAAWEAVIKRAREGADHPFQPTGHTDATEKHLVCQQVIATIGAGKSGSDVRKALGGTPFGWPRDAVDAALIALHRLQHITATLNGQADPARTARSEQDRQGRVPGRARDLVGQRPAGSAQAVSGAGPLLQERRGSRPRWGIPCRFDCSLAGEIRRR